jgi:hypothetical protein
MQRSSLKGPNLILKMHLGPWAVLPLDVQTQSMFTAARGISSSPFLLEEAFECPSVSFMAPEDQQHLIKAVMEGYASLPPSIPRARLQFLHLQLGRSGRIGSGQAGLHCSHKLPLYT